MGMDANPFAINAIKRQTKKDSERPSKQEKTEIERVHQSVSY
jgi:hypothetical protein